MTDRRSAVPWLLLLACPLMFVGPRPVRAQTPAADAPAPRAERYVQGGLGLAAGAPVGGFGTNVDSAGGFAGHLGVGLRDSPVSIGGEITYLLYGKETRRVSLRPIAPEIPDDSVDAITTNSILLSHARIRVQPRAGRWRPYVDALLGLNYLSTSTTIGGRDQFISGGTTLGDVGLSYGGGAGVTVGFGTPPRGTRLDLSLRFIGGPEADYLPEGAIRREDGQAILDISRSRTDMVVLYIGASWASR